MNETDRLGLTCKLQGFAAICMTKFMIHILRSSKTKDISEINRLRLRAI